MKKITVFILSFLVICSLLAACKEDKVVDSFLAGEIWEAILKSSDSTDDGQVIAYKLKEDGTFLFYQSIDKNNYKSFIITASGYYEHDEDNKKLVLFNGNKTDSIELSYEYDEKTGILTLNGLVAFFLDGNKQDVKLNFAKVSKEHEDQYREDATMSYKIEKQTATTTTASVKD